MKSRLIPSLILLASVACIPLSARGADAPGKGSLDVLKMEEIPPGLYDVELELAGGKETVRLNVRRNKAAFVEATNRKLEGLSGGFELIGNGVFLARLSGKNHTASQWWIFRPDGTALLREIPDRGEKQLAKPVTEK